MTDDYLTRAAAEDHARQEREKRERRAERRENERRQRDRIFEISKHMTTLSATALALIFGAQRLEVSNVDVVAGTVLFSLSLVQALTGMGAALLPEEETGIAALGTTIALIQIGISGTLFMAGVVFVVIWPSMAT